MGGAQELQVQVIEAQEPNLTKDEDVITQPSHPTPKRGYKWWLLMALYIFFVLSGQSIATLLGRLYYNKGGNSKWMQTIVVTAGFPFVLPLLIYFSYKPSIPNHNSTSNKKSPSIITLVLLYTSLGILSAGDNLMYAYGLLYLPVSTYALVCATQLAFNALFSYFINSLKFTPILLNSVVILTISASLLALHAESNGTTGVTKVQYAIGFLCTLGASALFSLLLSVTQLLFEKVLKKKTFSVILEMQVYPSIAATCVCLVGLFASREWWSLKGEMEQIGKVSYVMILVWTAVAWQVFNVGALSLIFEVSSLFSNVISTMTLPIVPIFGVIFFHDKMDGVKMVSLILAIWGFISYMYQNYLDDLKSKATRTEANESSNTTAS
ncbi:probable purine permease 11 [Macadamia integrifolia]|uniref:probable purine permease 11 n=1 Tax=Macadamia integrifolia TaxID=60698 RepID=UPI001C500B07|nr:probable purine permease 11 [Macadamia integrifolia]